LLHGGLPQQLLAKQRDPGFFSEWLDSFYARDVQELFNVRNRSGFIKCIEIFLRQSGGALNIENIAAESEISRPTAISYLDALSLSHAVIIVRPYHGGSKREITHQPRCYGFDTGFVCHEKGWNTLRNDDIGVLWEHLVLNVLQVAFGEEKVFFWRDKTGHEVDFIITENRDSVTAIECKNNPDKFRSKNLEVFRSIYPQGKNWVLAPGIKTAYKKKYDALTVDFLPLTGILEETRSPSNG
jgi:predicted AAA+ superfamily ATPase